MLVNGLQIFYAESEEQIQKVLLRKWENHNEIVAKMQQIIKKNGLSHLSIKTMLRTHISYNRDEYIGELFRITNTDSWFELNNLVNAMENGENNPMAIKLNSNE